MNTQPLDQEEQALLDAFEADEFESDLTESRRDYLADVLERQ